MSYKFQRQIIKNPDGKIKYRQFSEGGREHFHIGIWVEGSDQELDNIEKVVYKLHPSFRRRLRSSSNRKNEFSITIWTWGMFNIEATIHFKDGTQETHNYYLSYDLPPDNGDNYVSV